MKKKLTDYEKAQIIDGQSYEDENVHWSTGQKKSIDKFLIPLLNKDSIILDAACGDGTGLLHLIENGYSNVIGVDINDNKLEKAAKKVGKEKVLNSHISTLPYDANFFDVVWTSHTLEHSDNPMKTMAEFKRVVKPGGYILIIVPYPDHTHAIHCGVSDLYLDVHDNASTCITNLNSNGYAVEYHEIMNIREPELYIQIKK